MKLKKTKLDAKFLMLKWLFKQQNKVKSLMKIYFSNAF